MPFFSKGQSFKFNGDPKGVALPSQNVLDFEQDSLGRMWFSTAKGVVYSDGIQTYSLPDSLAERLSPRVSFHRDEDDVLWMYNAVGLPLFFRFTSEGWQEYAVPKPSEGDYSLRIDFFPIGRGKEKYYFLETQRQLYYWGEGDTEMVVVERDFSKTGPLTSVLDDVDGVILNFRKQTAKFEGGVLKQFSYRGFPLPSPPAVVKKSPASGEYYFLGEDYLAKGPKVEFPTQIVSSGFSTESILESGDYYSLEFRGENVLYHFNSHLLKYNPARNRLVLMDLSDELNTIFLQTIFLDREGILWVGTSRGMANNNSQLFQNYGDEVSDFLGQELTAIADLGQGSFLFGFNNGIQKFSNGAIKTLHKDAFPTGVPNHRIFNFSKEGKERVWFSANGGGVGYFDTRTERVSFFSPPAKTNIRSVQVAEDSLLLASGKQIFIAPLTARGKMLFATELTGQIDSLLKESPLSFRKAGKLKNGKIIVLRVGHEGIARPVVENSRYLLAEGYDYLELGGDSLLLATEFGLKVRTGGALEDYVYQGRTISNSVFALLKDSGGNIWVGTDHGVFVLGDNKFLHYKEKSGLIGDEINRGALVESSSGRIMIGTQKGLSIYFPEEDFYAIGAPKTDLISLKLGGQEMLGQEERQVPFSQNLLEVSFMAAAFNESRELWIHYRLSGGQDTVWTVAKSPTSNKLFFANLPAGTYQFELKVSYDGEDFSDVVVSTPFEIRPPIYLQWWFTTLAVCLLLMMGFLISMFFRQRQNVDVLQSAVDQESRSKSIAEEQFKNVWGNTQDGMILTLDGEEILTVNTAFAKLVDSEVRELEGKPMTVLFESDDQLDFYLEVLFKHVKRSPGKGMAIEMPVRWRNGTLEMEVYSVLLEGDYQGRSLILSVFRDVSAKKSVQNELLEAKEKAEEANRFKTSLLSNISHEIRTPLNGIIGGAEHLKMSRSGDPVLQSQLDIILQSGERLLSTINSLLDIAKIEANKMPVEYTETNLEEFIATILAPHRGAAIRKGLTLSFSFSGTSAFARVDRRFLEMIVNNLVSNSVKYSERGVISVDCHRGENLVTLTVTDTGVGISEEFQRRMFDPFEQESKGNDRLYEGTGLGLSITRNLVQLMSGDIRVESKIKKGTKVLVEIPLPQL